MLISFSTYQLIFYIWIAIALAIFFLLLKIAAPYGRHTSAKWGPQVDNHYGWFFMELPALTIMLYVLVITLSSHNFLVTVMIGLYCMHYFNRTFIFPFRLHTRGKKMPLVIMVSGIFFNLANTFLMGYYFIHFAAYQISWLYDARFIIGVIVFFCGVWINWKSDNILIHLRKPGETGYKMPTQWFFKYVSCPNMLGELIEWAGFAILCWNMPAVAFFIWTAANLIPRALAHHKWYYSKFADYPKEIKAIIPKIV